MPGEPFVAFQLRLAGESPIPNAWLFGCADGYFGYFPTIRAVTEGGYGAQGCETCVEVGAGGRARRKVYRAWRRTPILSRITRRASLKPFRRRFKRSTAVSMMNRGNPGTCNSTLTLSLHFGERSMETTKTVREMPKKIAALKPFQSKSFLDYLLPFR
jgi:hypothetical protein